MRADYVMKWTDEATAKSDAIAAVHLAADDQGAKQWIASYIIPNIKVWRHSQDTTDVGGNLVHNYLAGWFALISPPRRIAVIENSAALQLALDHDKMNAGLPPDQWILVCNFPRALLPDIRFEPIFDDMIVPWGGLN